MGEHQQPAACSSKTGKAPRFRFSSTAKVFLSDYFHNTSKAPRKQARAQILTHLKELGETAITDARITGWFIANRQKERKRRLAPPHLTSAPDPNDTKWVDVHHETLWPSLTRETLKDLEDLYTELVAENPNAKIPCEPWAKILDAKPVHVRMWCKAKERQPKRELKPGAAPMIEAPSQMTEERSQLPTPGNSTSPEPHNTSVAQPPPSLDAVKDEPPISPVVDVTPSQPPAEVSREKSSMGLYEAIRNAFSDPSCPPPPTTESLKPSSTTVLNHQRKSLSINSHGTLHVVTPPTPPLISVESEVAGLTSTPLPPASITSPSQSETSPPSSYRGPSVPPLPKESAPGSFSQLDRDLARERATLATGVAEKLNELNGLFNSAHGLAQFAGSIENIARRNEQFLKDVSAGRFAHLRLNNTHLPDRQTECSMSEYNPLRVLAEWQDGKGKGKEKDSEVGMEVD